MYLDCYRLDVVPYIGTWIETALFMFFTSDTVVVPYIGTWIETYRYPASMKRVIGRTLYRYVD